MQSLEILTVTILLSSFRLKAVSVRHNTKHTLRVRGIRWYNVQELVLQIKKSKLTFFFALEIKSEEKARKMENQLLVSPSRQCSSTPVGFVQGFLIKAQCYNTERPWL
jgi:hypothetical protein